MKNINRFLTILTVLAFAFSMNVLAASKVSVVRTLPTVSSPDSTFTVTLSMDVNESNTPIPAAVGLTEYYPSGWTVSNISAGGMNRTSPSRIEWLFWSLGSPVQDTTITYLVHVPASANGTYWFNGTININDGNLTDIAGDDNITILPYKITVTRGLPSIAYTGSNITVYLSLDVSETRKPNALGLVEFFPLGWTVSNISNGGIERNTSIEWLFSLLTSPVQDTNISYVLSVPSDANGTYNFTGQYNYTDTAAVSDATIGDRSVNATDRCAMMGDVPPCGVISIPEIVNAIIQWASGGDFSLQDIIAMINAWAHST